MENVWSQLTRNILSCQRCKAIVNARSRPVPGVGSVRAKIIVVGLAPGKDGADLTGIPFTRDPSGELFDQMLSMAGLSRGQDVFVTNLVKCNPKDSSGRNRTPAKEEIRNCLPYLRSEIEHLKPRVIVTLGRPATEFLLDEKIRNMNEFHGTKRLKDEILIIPFIHPSYVIRGAYDKKKYLREFRVVGDIFRDLIKQEAELSRLDILLLLLRSSSERGLQGQIRGRTKLQKLLFLTQRKLASIGYKPRYAFRPYLYGPYSQELYTDLEWLRMNGLVEINTEFDQRAGLMTDFTITEKGKRQLCRLIDSETYRNVDNAIQTTVSKYGEMSVAQLVGFVHKSFADYNQSRLKEKASSANVKLDDFIEPKPRTAINEENVSRKGT